MTENKEEKGVAVKDNPAVKELDGLNLFNEADIVAAESLMQRLVKSPKSGITSVNDGISILLRAKSLNLPFATCVEHIHVINGKTGIDIHIVKALLLKAGVTWKTIKRYAPLYEYTDGINVYKESELPDYTVRCISSIEAKEKRDNDKSGDLVYVYPVKFYKDFAGNVYKDYTLNPTTHVVVNSKAENAKAIENKQVGVYRIPNVPIDYVTTYEITRQMGNKILTAEGSFSISEARTAELLKKDIYVKYPKAMLSHRAFVNAARDICADLLLGCMEGNELKVVYDKSITSMEDEIEDIESEVIED